MLLKLIKITHVTIYLAINSYLRLEYLDTFKFSFFNIVQLLNSNLHFQNSMSLSDAIWYFLVNMYQVHELKFSSRGSFSILDLCFIIKANWVWWKKMHIDRLVFLQRITYLHFWVYLANAWSLSSHTLL